MKAAEEMSSSDEESYREKFENIKWLVNTLQRQLHEEQLRSKGVEALSACLEEEREKSQKLTEQKKKQERGIMVLQSRLEKHGLDSSLTLEEGEFLRPGSSRSLLENLMAENAKLKRNQKYLNVDPARLEQALQDIEKQKNHIKQLESTLQILREELDKAKTQLRASDSDKDKQILSLEAHVAELKRNKDTQSVLCHSLSAETTSLRQQLKDTMKQMQETMRRLELNDSDKDHSASNKELATAHAQLQELQHELEARNNRLQEVTDMNTRWQTYNKQRDQYVQELKQKLSEKQTPPENTDSLKTTIDQLHEQVQSLEQMKTHLEENNRQLRQRVEALQERNSTILDQEKANLYEAQIKLITEDFKQERDDRAREHERAEKLEKELSEVKAELDSLQRQNMQEFADRRQKSLENYEQQYYQTMYGNSAAGRLRNIGAQQAAFVTRGVRYECDDDLQQDSTADEEERSEDVVDTPTDDVLQCPKCNKCFPMDQHAELIEHLDQC